MDSNVSHIRPRPAVRDYSAPSVLSNTSVSSTKTHRRSAIEVSAILFNNGLAESNSIDTSDTVDAITTTLDNIKSGPDNANLSQGFEKTASTSYSIQIMNSSSDVLESTRDSDVKDGQARKLTHVSALCAAELIGELSFSCHPMNSRSNENSATITNATVLKDPEENDLPPSTPPLLPPIIRRLEMSRIIDIPSCRTRTRSTSISEMSINETRDDDDVEKSALSLMLTSSGNHEDQKNVLFASEFHVPAILKCDPRPVSLYSVKGSQSNVSCHSSYVSSSLSDDLTVEDIAEFETQDFHYKNFSSVRNSMGPLSSQCNPPRGGSMLTKPRLTSRILKEWDVLCEKSYQKRDISSIFRARSCFPTAPLPHQGGYDFDLQDDSSSVEQSGIRHMMSQSVFSYTNTASSSSTVSDDDVRSVLDFEVSLLTPIQIIPVPVQDSPKRKTI